VDGNTQFDALAAFAQGLHAMHVAANQARRDRRNARRRARYVPAAKRPAPAPAPAADLDEPEWEPTCRCYIVAPCTFCETRAEH
jgi:hypothetical protein